MSKSPLRVAAALAALLPFLASFPAATLANVKVCRSLEQRYEQIERGASTVEVNAMLFSAADKGCLDLAKLLLSDGRLGRGARSSRCKAARACGFSRSGRARHAVPRTRRTDRCARSRRLDRALQGGGDGTASDRPPSDRAWSGREAPRPQWDNAAFCRRLYGQRADRAVSDGQGRRSESDRQHAERPPSSMPRAGASPPLHASCSTMASTSTPSMATI